MSTTVGIERTSYGNWVPLRSPGLFGTGLAATVVMLATPVFALLGLLVAGPIAALLAAVVGGLAFLAVGTPAGPALTRRVVFHRHRAVGGTEWRAGTFSRNADPTVTLPGMAGRLQLLEQADAMGVPFAVVHDRRHGGLWTLVARCDADGPGMAETEQVDTWVAGWARFLATAGTDTALTAAKVIVDTAPDPGTRLATAVRDTAAPGAPALAVAVMGECAATYPALAARNTTWVELTFRGRALARKGERDLVLAELARRVPGVLDGLAAAGGGSVSMATATEIAATVRSAYDPAAHVDDDPGVEWCDAGPLAATEQWASYRHDSGLSVSWAMHDAPRAGIEATALGHLLAPQPGLARKRVAILLRPAPPDASARAAENDAATATFNAGGGTVRGRVTASNSLRVRATEQARHEVATGAVLVRFSVLVTATVTDPADLDTATAAVESAAGAVPLRLRRCDGSQAGAFAATLPIGFLPHLHTLISDKARELL
ncbi:MAG: SCO6880 family protein [Sporichthyaceae bacterium]